MAARSGRGGPNTTPLRLSVPVGPAVLQTGFRSAGLLPSLQPERQSLSFEWASTGKLWAVPVHPLSRSVPCSATSRSSWSGPPSGLTPQVRTLPPHVPVKHGLQISLSVSASFFGLPLASAITRIFFFPGFFLVPR